MSAASYCFCWKSEKACAVEPAAAGCAEVLAGRAVRAEVVGVVAALLASVVGCTGVTRRGRVAPDCAEASEAPSRIEAAVRLTVNLFMDGKFFIGRGSFSTRYAGTGREGTHRMPGAAGGFAGKRSPVAAGSAGILLPGAHAGCPRLRPARPAFTGRLIS